MIYRQYTFYTFATTRSFSEFGDEAEFSDLSEAECTVPPESFKDGLAISGDKSSVILGDEKDLIGLI